MRIALLTTTIASLVLLTGCPQEGDQDEIETVPEAPTHPPEDRGAPQFDEDLDGMEVEQEEEEGDGAGTRPE